MYNLITKNLQKCFFAVLFAIVSLCSYAQEMPLFSPEDGTNDVWYNIVFSQGGPNSLSDEGADAVLKTATCDFTADNQTWKLVGNPESFQLISKTGRKVNYNGSRFVAVDETDYALAIRPVTNGWNIVSADNRNGGMNQFSGAGTGKELGRWDYNDDNNKLNFYCIPTFSTDDNEVWYHINFNRGSISPADGGDGAALTTATTDMTAENQTWKLVGNAGSFQLVSKAGNTVYIEGGATDNGTAFKTAATAPGTGTELALKISGLGKWSIGAPGTNNGMNPYGGSSAGKEIKLYSNNDDGNKLSFYKEGQTPQDYIDYLLASVDESRFPTFSTDDNEVWYQIRFKKGGAAIQNMGNGNTLMNKTPSADNDAQLWKFVGDKSSFQIISKDGENAINRSSGNIITYPKDQAKFYFHFSVNTNNELIIVNNNGGQMLTQQNGAGTNRNISQTTDTDNAANPVFFGTEEDQAKQTAPAFSVEGGTDHWYYLFFSNGGGKYAVTAGANNGDDVKCKSIDIVDNDYSADQIWAFVGTAESFQLVSKSGKTIDASTAFNGNNGNFKTVIPSTSEGVSPAAASIAGGTQFQLAYSQNTTYPGAWELQQAYATTDDTSSKSDQSWSMNTRGGTYDGASLTAWTAGSNGNVVSLMNYTPLGVNEVASNGLAISVRGGVIAANGAKVVVYDLTGKQLAASSDAVAVNPAWGKVVIVKATDKNGNTVARKFAL